MNWLRERGVEIREKWDYCLGRLFSAIYFLLLVNDKILPKNIMRGVLTPKEEIIIIPLVLLGLSLFFFYRYFERTLPPHHKIFKGYLDMMLKDLCTRFVILILSLVFLLMFGKGNYQEWLKFLVQLLLFYISYVPLELTYGLTKKVGGFNTVNGVSIVLGLFIIIFFKDYFTSNLAGLLGAQIAFVIAIGSIIVLIIVLISVLINRCVR